MTSKAAQWERDKRKRLKDAGLVKMELWVLPANKVIIKAHESDMREKEIETINLQGWNDENA